MNDYVNDPGTMHTFTLTPPPVKGCYSLGNVSIFVTKRPSIVQQWFVRWCFGWTWHDAD